MTDEQTEGLMPDKIWLGNDKQELRFESVNGSDAEKYFGPDTGYVVESALSAKDAEIANLRRVLGVAKGALYEVNKEVHPMFVLKRITNEAITEIEKAGV